MEREALEKLVKRIANSRSYQEGVEDSNREDWNATHAIDYIFVTGALWSPEILSIFEELNEKEKYRFFHVFSAGYEQALYAGQISEFNSIEKCLKDRYLFIFKRAFRRHFLLEILLGIAPFVLLRLFFPEQGSALVLAAVAFYFSYNFLSVKKKIYVTTEQNDLLIREIKKLEISEAEKRLASALCETGWLKNKRTRT